MIKVYEYIFFFFFGIIQQKTILKILHDREMNTFISSFRDVEYNGPRLERERDF